MLSEATADIRATSHRALQTILNASSDKPKAPLDAALVRVLFLVQVGVVLALTQDESRNAKHTHSLVDAMSKALALTTSMSPIVGPFLLNFDALVSKFFDATRT